MISFKENAVGLAFLITVLLGMIWGILTISSPEPYQPELVLSDEIDSSPVLQAVQPAAIERLKQQIDQLGTRTLGHDSLTKSADFISEQYSQNGLEVYRLAGTVPAPVTSQRRIQLANSDPMPAVEIYPLPPNAYQPVVTPADGLKGRLVLLDEESLLGSTEFTDTIGVLRLDKIPRVLGLSWTRYAQMGIKGLIFVHPQGIEAMPWQAIFEGKELQSTLSVNFPRLAANAKLLDYIGQDVRIDVTSKFEPAKHETIVGVLRAQKGATTNEAVVFNVAYDQYSILPDYGASSLQSYPLATHLALVKGLAAQQTGQQRDLIFVASSAQFIGFAGLDHLLRMLGPVRAREVAAQRVEQQIETERTALQSVKEIEKLLQTPGFLKNTETTLRAEETLSKEAKDLFKQELRYTLSTLVFEASETVLNKRIEFEKGDVFALDRPEYDAYLKAQFIHDDLATASNMSLARLVERTALGSQKKVKFTDSIQLLDLLSKRIAVLRQHHSQQLQINEAGLALNQLFSNYTDLSVISPALLPRTASSPEKKDQISFILGGPVNVYKRATSILSSDIAALIERVILRKDMSERIALKAPSGSTAVSIYRTTDSFPSPASNWSEMGYRAFSLINTDRLSAYKKLNEPYTADESVTAESMAASLEFTAEFAHALSQGLGNLDLPPRTQPRQYSGNVYASDVGRSLIPNYPMSDLLIAPKNNQSPLSPARYEGLLQFTDPYGAYELPDTSSQINSIHSYNLQAFGYDSNGLINYVKDESNSTQALFSSIFKGSQNKSFTNINLVVFRASPVAILDLVNPQTLRPFTSISLLRAGSLTDFDKSNTFTDANGILTFIPPDSYFYTTFRSGTPDNELVQTVRSYMGGEAPQQQTDKKDITGTGYLAADHAIAPNVALEQAQSMHRLNQTRLQLQEAKGLADEHTLKFHKESTELLEQAANTDTNASFFERMITARDSLTYSIIIHPILRQNINNAVISILWYMALLIPFMFFFEKLVFGFSDIRKQLAAQVFIFLAVFMLLRLLHPAFEMIRSSIMILLGFFILLISLAMTLLFAGKFRENLAEIKQQRGKASGAEVNTMGVIATAFMLGLNNMHRRKVRTGLTCLTLVLITFAMICFTSIYSDFEDSEIPLGPADYQGLLVKNEKFAPISDTERFAIESNYGFEFPIAPRAMYLGTVDMSTQKRLTPTLEIVNNTSDGRSYSREFSSIVRFAHNEPLRDKIPFISDPFWFQSPENIDQDAPTSIIIPNNMAEQLGIPVEAVNAGGVPVNVNGAVFMVRGIFDATEFNQVKDLDGRAILPFDVRGLVEIEQVPGQWGSVLGDENGIIVPPSDIILAPFTDLGISVANADNRLVSLALDFESLNLREAREQIMRFLEQRARPAFYGVDGTAYRGSRMRVSSFAGLVDLIIPLLIAALTVLNTMKGSVYERRDEIYVYNAVGIAPRFIFFMFFTEAFVYAVVGCVLGYLLSQGTGTVLTALDLTGGMNMTFASVNSIYASLAVVGAVFISTYFPAKSAMNIAAPAEDAGWEMPPPEEDVFNFNLPFTFDRYERVAVLVFFQRFIADHGEGGSGNFSAGPPQYDIVGEGNEGPQRVVPSVNATIWLKPYDLGVSQQFSMSTPIDPETGDFIAAIRIIRLSGTRESWQRVNRQFVVAVRKQLLHWRAVSPEIKTQLYQEARTQFTAKSNPQSGSHGS